jgi:hypothetical protein
MLAACVVAAVPKWMAPCHGGVGALRLSSWHQGPQGFSCPVESERAAVGTRKPGTWVQVGGLEQRSLVSTPPLSGWRRVGAADILLTFVGTLCMLVLLGIAPTAGSCPTSHILLTAYRVH